MFPATLGVPLPREHPSHHHGSIDHFDGQSESLRPTRVLNRELPDRCVHTLLLPGRKSFLHLVNAFSIVLVLPQEEAASLVSVHRLSEDLLPQKCDEKFHRSRATAFEVTADLPLFKPVGQVPFKGLFTESPQVLECQILNPSSFVANLGAQLVIQPRRSHDILIDPLNLEQMPFRLFVCSAVPESIQTNSELQLIKLKQETLDVLLILNSAHYCVPAPQHQELH